MRLSKKLFGPQGIRIQFHNGVQFTDGYVVRQLSTNRFRVTDGNTTKDIALTMDSHQAAILNGDIQPQAGETDTVKNKATIAFTSSGGGTLYAGKLLGRTMTLTNGTTTAYHVNNLGDVVDLPESKTASTGHQAPQGFSFATDAQGNRFTDNQGNLFYIPA